jgi:hypothetical protein
MSETPNQLERALLEAFARAEPNEADLVHGVRVTGREFTGVGCFIMLAGGPTNVELQTRVVGLPVVVEALGLKHGLGASVTIGDGRLEFLEVVSFGGESWGPELETFVVWPA